MSDVNLYRLLYSWGVGPVKKAYSMACVQWLGFVCAQVLKDVGGKFKERPFSYLWVEGGKQPALEKALEVGGYVRPRARTEVLDMEGAD